MAEADDSNRFRATFPHRLHCLLSNAAQLGVEDILSWHSSGDKFIIHRRKEFVEKILPNIFKQSMFSSFRRQINAYGFEKELANAFPTPTLVYSHKYFQRDNPSACRQLKRRRPNKALSKALQKTSSGPVAFEALIQNKLQLGFNNLEQSFPQMITTSNPESAGSLEALNQNKLQLGFNYLEQSFPQMITTPNLESAGSLVSSVLSSKLQQDSIPAATLKHSSPTMSHGFYNQGQDKLLHESSLGSMMMKNVAQESGMKSAASSAPSLQDELTNSKKNGGLVRDSWRRNVLSSMSVAAQPDPNSSGDTALMATNPSSHDANTFNQLVAFLDGQNNLN